jgi:competence ComEA-like helix-hairpin-helix protein
MVKALANSNIKIYFYGLLSGILISGILLVILKNPQFSGITIVVPDSHKLELQSTNASIICINNSQNMQEFALININEASADELISLPGIGDAKARNIITWREKYSNYKTISELMYISGISDSLFQQICNLITIGK